MIRILVCCLAVGYVLSCSSDNSTTSGERWPETFDIGRAATDAEIASKDIDVGPDGAGLLHEGKGTVSSGAIIYVQKCAVCHGKDGTDGPFGALVINDWPYATTLYDYINRAMPFDKPGSLTKEEVFNLTAFILCSNKIIDSTTVIDYKTLPAIVMPAHEMFVDDDRRGGAEVR